MAKAKSESKATTKAENRAKANTTKRRGNTHAINQARKIEKKQASEQASKQASKHTSKPKLFSTGTKILEQRHWREGEERGRGRGGRSVPYLVKGSDDVVEKVAAVKGGAVHSEHSVVVLREKKKKSNPGQFDSLHSSSVRLNSLQSGASQVNSTQAQSSSKISFDELHLLRKFDSN